ATGTSRPVDVLESESTTTGRGADAVAAVRPGFQTRTRREALAGSLLSGRRGRAARRPCLTPRRPRDQPAHRPHGPTPAAAHGRPAPTGAQHARVRAGVVSTALSSPRSRTALEPLAGAFDLGWLEFRTPQPARRTARLDWGRVAMACTLPLPGCPGQ